METLQQQPLDGPKKGREQTLICQLCSPIPRRHSRGPSSSIQSFPSASHISVLPSALGPDDCLHTDLSALSLEWAQTTLTSLFSLLRPRPTVDSSSSSRTPSAARVLTSSSSSGVPSRQAHASTNLRTSRGHQRFIMSNRKGTRAMIKTGNAGAAFVKVRMKMATVRAI